jgi:uncharacterized glyoxalase superfamily protein PhnB
MKTTPPGWPRITSCLFYEDAPKAIDWLRRAFGFEARLVVEGDPGTVVHSELVFGDGLIGVSTAAPDKMHVSPKQTGGKNTQSLFLYVDDVEAHCKRARDTGAKILTEPKTSDYGDEYWVDRSYECEDLEGHRWWFGQRMKTKGQTT